MYVNSINLFYEDTPQLALKEKIVSKYVNLLISNEKHELGELSIIFCSDLYLLEMNKTHLDHDYFTDIITFNYVEGRIISGDLFISVDRVKDNAKHFGANFANELFRVILHGVLHLVGYNDKTTGEQKVMREKENLYLGEVDFSEIEL